MTEHRLVTDAEAEKVQHVAEAVGFFTHTCGYQPGCLCTEMYPARIKRLLATRAACVEVIGALVGPTRDAYRDRIGDLLDDLGVDHQLPVDYEAIRRGIALLADLHGTETP